MNLNRRAVWVIAAIAFFVLFIVLLATMGDRCAAPQQPIKRCGHAWSNWIFDFQSLIAGFTALVAAIFTIYTMTRNTRDMIYVEWKTTVFKVHFLNKQLGEIVRVLDSFIRNKVPVNTDSIEWSGYIQAIYVKLINLESMLDDALEAGLSMYSLGMIRGDKELISQLVSDYKNIHKMLLHDAPVTQQEIANILFKNQMTHVAFRRIQTNTMFGFKTFLDNTAQISPHNLKV